MRRLFFALAFAAIAVAQQASNGSFISIAGPRLQPANPPAGCSVTPYNFQQTATYNWTTYCPTKNGPASMRGGQMQATGTGHCSGLGYNCAVDASGDLAPLFQASAALNPAGTAYLRAQPR
jgi:hypothetical protein